jgi:hypothetical protein
MSVGLALRFRDLVTERGGTIEEHVRVSRRRGFVWWGWWYRQSETVPTEVLGHLFPEPECSVPIVLFDAGMLALYTAIAGKVVLAPSGLGLPSPDFDATPEYYLRGRYPAWFRLSEITPAPAMPLRVIERPTIPSEEADAVVAMDVPLDALRDERPTLWVIDFPDAS